MTKTSKELVISHALQLFKVQGYHKTSMADIGTACGLLKGSIYNYFASKEALAIAAMEFVHDLLTLMIKLDQFPSELPALPKPLKSISTLNQAGVSWEIWH